MKQTWILDGETIASHLAVDGDSFTALIGEDEIRGEAMLLGSHTISINVGGRRVLARVAADGARRYVALEGRVYELELPDPRALRRRGAGQETSRNRMRAPISGSVFAVKVAPGDEVEEDQVLVIVEAMKMEHRVKAPRAGVVESVECEPGQMVDQDQVVVALVKEDEGA